jgi:hypothetical protein
MCVCRTVPPLLFQGQRLLRSLNLGHNLLTGSSLLSTAFAGLVSLEELVSVCV